MKVLVTGATGFVGSHILDTLRARGVPTVLLLRPTSPTRFISRHLSDIETRTGSVLEPNSLRKALEGITHVVHCAGCTKASRYAEYYEVNHGGTRNVVEAVNSHASSIQRLLHLSSLAVAGPATPENPAREGGPLRPISEYGKSKLAGELEVRDKCRVPYTILRPPAVYGPRDTAFLPLFRAVRNHLLPRASKIQNLSLAFASDLAEAIVICLEQAAASRKTYFVASREVVSAGRIADEIGTQMKSWTMPLPMPSALLWFVCFTQEFFSRATGRATLLNLQKFTELRAPGWVCDPSQLEREVGYRCVTPLETGITATLEWYRREHWL